MTDANQNYLTSKQIDDTVSHLEVLCEKYDVDYDTMCGLCYELSNYLDQFSFTQ